MNRPSPIPLFIFLFAFTSALAVLPPGSLRAAYGYAFGRAYSAGVDLPSYTVVDLGPDRRPISVNDALDVLLDGENGELLRWRGGREEVLATDFHSTSWADMNETGTVVASFLDANYDLELRRWEPGGGMSLLNWNTNLLAYPYFTGNFVLTDSGFLFLRVESESKPVAIPPYTCRIETRVMQGGGVASTLASYEYHLAANFAATQGGVMLDLADANNYRTTVSEVYEDKASSDPFSGQTTYTYQDQYFALGRHTRLNFEGLQINDVGTVLGRSLGPLFGMEILDGFGQRSVGPILADLADSAPKMSNPDDGLEEIVLNGLYWKRMSERDFTGMSNGRPAPDFWQGTLADIATFPAAWSQPRATCISANGRIAGTAWVADPATGTTTRHGFLLIPPALLPDWNRDGSIDDKDRRLASAKLPWRFWINDDDDHGEEARKAADDLPDSPEPDWISPGVDGLRDVVDFFPVLVDLGIVLQATGSGGVEIRLSHAGSALNLVYSDLDPRDVRRIHTGRITTGFGPLFNEPLAAAPAHPVGPQPFVLNAAFLDNLRTRGRGVLLFEVTAPTTEPLVMEFRYNGTTVFTHELPLSTGPVTSMFRVLNLRNSDPKFAGFDPGPLPTSLGEPANLPDSWLRACSGFPWLPDLVHVHGYNWKGDEIPAGHAEIFKRFHQLGSHGRYIGVSWPGDQGVLDLLGTSIDYNENVINAFITAPHMVSALAGVTGPLTSVFAHSLGNMVVSSALVDHGWDILNYFMLNVAVPNEAYLGEQADRRLMVHPDWKDEGDVVPDYPEHLLAANWSRLFPANDRRSGLTWKDRFHSVSSAAICRNFYSSAEDVLRPGNGDLPNLLAEVVRRELVWVYNEMLKGTGSLAPTLTGDVQAGWGFNREWMTWYDPGGPAHPPSGEWQRMSTVEAISIAPKATIADPFFRPFSGGDGDFPAWGDGGWLYEDSATANARLPDPLAFGASPGLLMNHAKILAEAIPAHSAAAGATRLPNIPLLQNVDLDAVFRDKALWPERDSAEKRDRWLHSDYLNPALPCVARLYLKCIESINTVQ